MSALNSHVANGESPVLHPNSEAVQNSKTNLASASESSTGGVSIRLAHDETDIAAMIAIGHRLHVESRFRVFPYDETKLKKLGRAALANRNPGVILAELGGHLVGFAVVAMGEHFFSAAKTATVQLLYVVPEARAGRAPLLLLHALRRWSAHAGALELHVNVTTAIAPAKADRLFRRLGFKQTGGNYVLEKL